MPVVCGGRSTECAKINSLNVLKEFFTFRIGPSLDVKSSTRTLYMVRVWGWNRGMTNFDHIIITFEIDKKVDVFAILKPLSLQKLSLRSK